MDDETAEKLRLEGLRFRVFGTPVPKGSTRAFVNKKAGRAHITSVGGEKLVSWNTNVQDRALEAVRLLMKSEQPELPVFPRGTAVIVELGFAFQKPPSVPKKRTWPTVRPDLDKAIRSVLDAMTGIIWRDDNQVIVLTAHKMYGDTSCCDVEVKAL